jgi:MoaA/NifB/PqqE/SkfB family radical SAM enzyme
MHLGLLKRLLLETDKRLLWKLGWCLGVKGLRAVQKHKRRLKRGQFFPPYLYISMINSCNLECQGCWVDVTAPQQKIDLAAMNRMITEAKAMGNSFFGLLGGEPFMHGELFDVLEAHRDVYFQIFTNGHFITDETAERMRRLGNASPLVSIEGSEVVSDERRGGKRVWSKSMQGLQHCLDNRLLTGVCTSVCQSNIDDLLTEEWIDRLIEMGVLYTWFHIYRPVGPNACSDLALTAEQQRAVRRFVVDLRVDKPIIVIDAYHDADGKALCPSAVGFTHHINPWGDIEPCPVIQFAKDSIHDERPLREVFNDSEFLSDYRRTVATHTRGCVVLERPDLLRQLVQKHAAHDATARGTALEELDAMTPGCSQYSPGDEIPERSWVYRLAKRLALHEYGAYSKHFQSESWIDHRRV